MTADQYLWNILRRETVDTGPLSPIHTVQGQLEPILREWAGDNLEEVRPSGSFAKGTAVRSGTDIDLFVSLSPQTTETLKEIYEKLAGRMKEKGYSPRRQNVSINITVGSYSVDLVPAKRQNALSGDHSLYRRRVDTWTKTNVAKHVGHVVARGRLSETRVIKLWRNQKGLEFPSFYLELTVIDALSGRRSNSLADNVWAVFEYLRDSFSAARVVDPANTNNIVSDDLAITERHKIRDAAKQALSATDWDQIVI